MFVCLSLFLPLLTSWCKTQSMKAIFAGGSVCTQYLLLPWEGGILFEFFYSFPPFRKDFRPGPFAFLWGALGLNWNSFRDLSLCKYENNKQKTRLAEAVTNIYNRSSPKMGVLTNKIKETRKQKKN
jgi:hypothetical protein